MMFLLYGLPGYSGVVPLLDLTASYRSRWYARSGLMPEVLALHPQEAYPMQIGHSIFKVLCLLTKLILPKKQALSRMSKTMENGLKSAYFHAYGESWYND